MITGWPPFDGVAVAGRLQDGLSGEPRNGIVALVAGLASAVPTHGRSIMYVHTCSIRRYKNRTKRKV